MICFPVKTLDSCLVIADECNNDISVSCIILFGYDQIIAFLDTGINHAVSANDKNKAIIIFPNKFRRHREDRFQVFISDDWFTCTNSSDQRHRNHLLMTPGSIIDNFDSSGAGRIPFYNAKFFQAGKISMYC
nr:MAG TPA: hypothetical protein [Caudoviricetes sp.]